MEEPCEFDWLTVKRDAIAEIHKQVVHSAKLWDAVKGSQLTTQEQLLTLVEVATISESIKRNVASEPASAELLVRVSSSNLSEQDKHAIASSFLQQQSWKIDDDVLRGVASFAGYDGAIVMTRDLKVLGFGAKITVKGKAAPQVCTFEAYPGKQKIEPKEERFRGTPIASRRPQGRTLGEVPRLGASATAWAQWSCHDLQDDLTLVVCCTRVDHTWST